VRPEGQTTVAWFCRQAIGRNHTVDRERESEAIVTMVVASTVWPNS